MSASIFFSYLTKTAFVFMLFCRHVVRLRYESFDTSQESLVSCYSAIKKTASSKLSGAFQKGTDSFVAKIGGM